MSNKMKSMSIEDVTKLLAEHGIGSWSITDLEKDIATGAPQNEDGTINLVKYTAWVINGGRNEN